MEHGPRADDELRTAGLFSVPEGVKYLDDAQLARLTQAFRDWAAEARGARSRRARLRVWLVYLLLRYSGARLGEVLALDERRDFDAGRSLVRFAQAGGEEREVALPGFVMDLVEQTLEEPCLTGLKGEVFHLDQGYLRRKFYEQAERSSLPRDLLAPRVLRHSRAIELLRDGIPLPAMQAVLGLSTLSSASSYYSLSDDELGRIVQHYVRKTTRLKTSARNTFVGTVTAVREGVILSEVRLKTRGDLEIVSIITNESAENLDIRPGRQATAVVKAPWVILAREPLAGVSARNRFAATITRINMGSMSAEVIGELDEGTPVCAMVTDESVRELDLKLGDRVWYLFKAFSVILNVD